MVLNWARLYIDLCHPKKLELSIQFKPKNEYSKCFNKYLQGLHYWFNKNQKIPLIILGFSYSYNFQHHGGNLNYKYNFNYKMKQREMDFKQLNPLVNEIQELLRQGIINNEQLTEALRYLKYLSEHTNERQKLSYDELNKLFNIFGERIDKSIKDFKEEVERQFKNLTQDKKDIQEIKELLKNNNQDLEEIKKRLSAIEKKL